MKFIAAKCPACNGELQVPDDRDFVKCMYCGVDVKIREAIKMTINANIPNLMRIANDSLKSENYKESYDYFTKILEYEINNYEAWLGKGESAAMQSTLANPRMKEMITCFNNAINNYKLEDLQVFKEKSASKINEICNYYFISAKKTTDRYLSVDSTWPNYLAQCEIILDTLEKALEFNPNDKKILKGIIHICRNNIAGVSYTEQVLIGNAYRTVTKHKSLPPNYKKLYKKKIDNCLLKYKTLEPEKWKIFIDWQNKIVRAKKINNNLNALFFIIPIIGFILIALLNASNSSSGLIVGVLVVMVIGFISIVVLKKPIPKEPKELSDIF